MVTIGCDEYVNYFDCGNHFSVYIYQNMLYTLNIYNLQFLFVKIQNIFIKFLLLNTVFA